MWVGFCFVVVVFCPHQSDVYCFGDLSNGDLGIQALSSL